MTTGDSSAADASQRDLRGVLPAGTRLQKYELISVLGHGSFGITYRARDTQLDRDVAIKEYLPITLALREDGAMVVPRSTELSGEFVWGRERFLGEARTLAKLGHAPAIVRVYDFLEANGTAYMVMGLAEGETLESRLNRDGSLPAPVIEKILYPLLDGLEQVHKASFLHRDIKPANILLDAEDNPTLIDFGASRAAIAGRSTAMTAIFTPGYAALEQFASGRQEPTTDIYGLSATLYRAVAGKEPPSAIDRVIEDRYVPLSGLAPAGFAPGLLSGIDAGLALKANQRPQSIAEWRSLLTQARVAMAGDTVFKPRHIPATPPMAPAPTPAPTPAEPAVVPNTAPAGRKSVTRLLLAGAAAVLLLVAGGGYYAVIGIRAEQERQRVEEQAQRKAVAEAEAKRQADAALARAQAEQQRAEQEAAKLREALEAKQQAEAGAAARAKAAAESAAAQNAASLRASLETIRARIAQQARLAYSGHGHDSSDGRSWTYRRLIEQSNVTTDEPGCRIRFHWRVTTDDVIKSDADVALKLRGVTNVALTTAAEAITQTTIKEHPTWSTTSTEPLIWEVTLVGSDGAQAAVDFSDRSAAQAVADAARQVAKLCP